MSVAPTISAYSTATLDVFTNGGIGAKDDNNDTDLKAWISNRFRQLPSASTPSGHSAPSSGTPLVPPGSTGAVRVPPGMRSHAPQEIDPCIQELLKLTPCTGATEATGGRLDVPEALVPFVEPGAEQQTQGQLIQEWKQARSRCDMLGRQLNLERELSRRLEAEMSRLRRELPRTTEVHEQLRGQASEHAEEQLSDCQMLHASHGISSRPQASNPPPLQVASPMRKRQPPTDHKHQHCTVSRHSYGSQTPASYGSQTPALPPAERPADTAWSPRTTPPSSMARSRSQQGLQPRGHSASPSRSDRDEVDVAWCQVMKALPRDLPHDWSIIKERRGVYRLPGHSTAVLARLSHQGLQVRVGGGWMPAGRFLLKHWPADLGDGGGGAVARGRHLSPTALIEAMPTPQRSPASHGGSTPCTPAFARSPSLDRLLAPTESWARRVDARRDLVHAARERCRRNSPGRPDRACSPGRSCSWRSVAGFDTSDCPQLAG